MKSPSEQQIKKYQHIYNLIILIVKGQLVQFLRGWISFQTASWSNILLNPQLPLLLLNLTSAIIINPFFPRADQVMLALSIEFFI